jgi:hypothetical protein
MDDDECGAVVGMLGRENRNTPGKPALAKLIHHKSHNT